MVDPISLANLMLGGASFAWEVGRSIYRRASENGRGSSSSNLDHRANTRQQITRTYSSPQVFASRPAQGRFPLITVFRAQRSEDTYEDEDIGISMGAGFNPRLIMAAESHWRDPLGDTGLRQVMVVDWTNRLAWAYVHVRGCYHLWYKVENVNLDYFLHPSQSRYAVATVTMVDGSPLWSDVPLEVMDGSGDYSGDIESENAWTRLGIRHSAFDVRRGERVFVGMTRALLMGILVGRYKTPTRYNVDTLLDDDQNTYISIDSDRGTTTADPVKRAPAQLTVFRRNTRHWADEFVWVG